MEKAAEYLSGPAGDLAGAVKDATNTSIRENTAFVFGVTALTCFLLGAFWKSIVR